jgi:hypothetical protein
VHKFAAQKSTQQWRSVKHRTPWRAVPGVQKSVKMKNTGVLAAIDNPAAFIYKRPHDHIDGVNLYVKVKGGLPLPARRAGFSSYWMENSRPGCWSVIFR